MAFGLVFLTSIVVAYLSSSIIPGLTVAMGFLLGGVNSPPDAVAATSVLKHMKIPKKITNILEGESLINDASSLIVFKFALAAVISGQFIWRDAVQDFFTMAIGGIAVGVAVGFLFGALLRIIPTNSNIDTVITYCSLYYVCRSRTLPFFRSISSGCGRITDVLQFPLLSEPYLKDTVRKCLECVDIPDEYHYFYPYWS
jgi:NhaP-type Na+/H+ or K+/H+ antiporter